MSDTEICVGCPYYYDEGDVCMEGEDDFTDNLEKKCQDELFDIYCKDGKTIIGSLREIYEKGRTDREKELAELPNEYSEKLWENAYNRGRKDAIDEIAEDFNEHLFDSPMMNPIMTRNEILLFLEQLKDKKGGTE